MEKETLALNYLLPIEYWENEFKNGWKNGYKPNPHLLDFLQNYPIGPAVLDVGCGDGRHLIPMAKIGHNMTGLELTDEGIKTTLEKLNELNLQAQIIQGDFHKLPFVNEGFDSIISIQALHYNDWKGAEKCFCEISRVLKSDGYFFFRARSEKGHWRSSDEAIPDKGITRREFRGADKFVCIVHDYTLPELEELAQKNKMEIIHAHDEDDNACPGQWNVIFRKN